MHLLAATPGQIDDGLAPVDPQQTPSDVVFISAADSELAALSMARSELPDAPGLRLLNLANLRHPMSVDLHLDNCATESKLVIARILGGVGYWKYGTEQYAARCHEAGVPIALLPGDDKPDEELRTLSTVKDEDYDALWAYLVEGGPENSRNFLSHARAICLGGKRPPAASPLLRAGIYWPGKDVVDVADIEPEWIPKRPVVPIIFYRALLQGAGLNPVNRLARCLVFRGMNPLPVFVASLKDPVSVATLNHLFIKHPPAVILNCTSFAVGSLDGSAGEASNPLAMPSASKAPVFQVVLAGATEDWWAGGKAGLGPRDIAMNVALPEVDGRILSRAVSFKGEAFFDEATECSIATYRANGDRVDFVAELAANWALLQNTSEENRRVAIILANYPNRDGRLANGVGLDVPASAIRVLQILKSGGYDVGDAPSSPESLMRMLLDGPTNQIESRAAAPGGEKLPVDAYADYFNELPLEVKDGIEARWGAPENDPFIVGDSFKLAIHRLGNVAMCLQPARGYNINPAETYHSPDLVPPHNYLAFYFWLRREFQAHAIMHMGKHGNLEWLPGKAVALSSSCWPEVALGPVPHIYPFIVNDPGEGTQAKRRAQAVIADHLTPPLTRAESYGPMRDLEVLVDEYYEAVGVDSRRLTYLRSQILSLCSASGIDIDAGITDMDADSGLVKLDAYLCELKEAQIRDGLHVFGVSPQGERESDLAIALARMPRDNGTGGNASLLRAMADDLNISIDPLDCEFAEPAKEKPDLLKRLSSDPWRSNGDTVERLELYARRLLSKDEPGPGQATERVLRNMGDSIRPAIARCGPNEEKAVATALDGRAIPAGPSGAPTRGRPDTLPTGRNFYSVDSRAIPTPAAWALGWKSACLLVDRHLQMHGEWPRAMLLTAWGTSNMRTGGDDIAQAMALIGAKPKWDSANRRVVGFEIMPHGVLGRPRVDVTLRISGFFRDAFPQLIDLFDSAARAVQRLEEPEDVNPAATRMLKGEPRARVYGSRPGAYGAGLQAMIDERLWADKGDLAEAYLVWGSYAYEAGREGIPDRSGFETRLIQVDAIIQNQDNREHDILDSDDYYQFEGGAAAAVHTLQGRSRPIYHNDHSRPERPLVRTLEDEIGRVVRSRVANPKWISGVKKHGYKGAFEIAASVDYLFAFAATTGAVANHHFDIVEQAVLQDDGTREFIRSHNCPALHEIAERLREAIDRGLWKPRSNSARVRIDSILKGLDSAI
ncbi:MAG: cobaltochelatase subunit CobN [Roseovarius sp.]|nr:cobaltochelatase subunit CobN [Roseovarius sp.]